MKKSGKIMTGVWLVVLVLGSAAGAKPPQVFHTQISDTFTIENFCGFTVDVVSEGTDTFEVFFDRFGNVSRIQDENHFVATITNEANGKVVYLEVSNRFSQPAPVVNANGTITFTPTYTGLPEHIYTSHSDTLVKDVGFITFVTTFDSEGMFISQVIEIEHGPHPEADSDGTLFCAAITSAIG